MVEKKITEAAEILARKQLGLEPKKDGVDQDKDLPEMLVKYIEAFDDELTEKFKEICANMELRFGLKNLSDDTMLTIANKINDEAQKGNLNNIASISQSPEIVTIAEKAAIKQQRVEAINRIIDGDEDPMRKGLSEKILGAAILATMDSEYDKVLTADDKELSRIHGLEHAMGVMGRLEKYKGEDGKIRAVMELGFIGATARAIGLNREMSLDEAKALAITKFSQLDPDKYKDFVEKCRTVTSKEELEDTLAREFYNTRAERNGGSRESYEDFKKKLYSAREISKEERDELQRKAKMSPKERRECERLETEKEARRDALSKRFKEINNKMQEGNVDYQELTAFLQELRTSEFQSFYQGVMRSVDKRAKESGDVSLGQVHEKFVREDQKEARKDMPEGPEL